MGNEYIAPGSLMPSSMPSPGVYKKFISGRERFGQEAAYFNSEVLNRVGYGGNATLTIWLRLHLVRRDRTIDITPRPTLEDGSVVEIVPWGKPTGIGRAYDFEEFKDKVKQQAEKFWDKTSLCLVPPADYRGLEYVDGGKTVRPNIDCRFQIRWPEGAHDAHAVIDCFCPTRPRRFRPHVRPTAQGALGGQWTCYDLVAFPGDIFIPEGKECVVDVGDPLGTMTTKTIRCNKELAHEAVCHEVGHLLGLSHVGKFFKTPECLRALKEDPGAQACYRGPTNLDTENIMGAGDKIASWNVMPWAARVTSHTGIGLQGWRVSPRNVLPRRL